MKNTILLSLTLAITTAAWHPTIAATGRNQQEQQFRQQQQEARRGQEEALRAQEEQARQAQQQARQAQEQQARAQQDARRALEEQSRQAQQQQRQAQEQQARAQQDQQRQAQQAQQEQQRQARQAQQEQQRMFQQAARQAQQQSGETRQFQEKGWRGQEHRMAQAPTLPPGAAEFSHLQRAVAPRELNVHPVALEKAVAMPMFDQQLISAGEHAHADQLRTNLLQHLLPIPLSQAPPNYAAFADQTLGYYANNYQLALNNQLLSISRANTYVNTLPLSEYPYWYQPEPGWVYSNGFTLGDAIRVGLDWLGFGWHPYFGPTPTGFICAAGYMPTAWVYYPAYGLWRMAGANGWAQAGPPYDYAGPISVEVLEPRLVSVADPNTGWRHQRYINVPYLYNAYFYPDYDRWGYANRHGYFVWLNV